MFGLFRNASANPPIKRDSKVKGDAYRPHVHPVRVVDTLGAREFVYDTYAVPKTALHGNGFGSYNNRYFGLSTTKPMLARKTFAVQGLALPAGRVEKSPLSRKPVE